MEMQLASKPIVDVIRKVYAQAKFRELSRHYSRRMKAYRAKLYFLHLMLHLSKIAFCKKTLWPLALRRSDYIFYMYIASHSTGF